MSLRDWPAPGDDHLIYADGLRVPGTDLDLGMALRAGEVVVIDGQANSGKTALMLTLAGRMRLGQGRAKITGLVLPEQAASIRGRTAVIDCTRLEPLHQTRRGLRGGLRAEIMAAREASAAVIFVDHADVLSGIDDRAALASLVEESPGADHGLVISARDRALVEDLITVPYRHLTLGSVPDLADSNRLWSAATTSDRESR